MSNAQHAAPVGRWARARSWIAGGAAIALIAGLLVTVGVLPQAAASAPAPGVSLAPTTPYLAGEDLDVTVTIDSDPAAGAQYNLSVGLLAPTEVTLVSPGTLGSPRVFPAGTVLASGGYLGDPAFDCAAYGLEPADPPAAAGTCAVPIGFQYLVFQNISDLPEGASTSHSITLRPDASAFPVGSDDLVLRAVATTSDDERFVPTFPGSTGVATGTAHTSLPGVDDALIAVAALRIEKREPSPESELLRGVHENSTTYTLRLSHTGEGDIEDVVVIDHLPAGLEYLGLGGTDNTTDANGTQGGGAASVEYPGAPRLTSTPAPAPAPGAWQSAGESVETIQATAADAAQFGLVEGAVYTRVTWNLGTLLATTESRDLVPGVAQVYADSAGTPGALEIRYRAGIPLFENTLDFGYEAAVDGQQIANLDNNRGPSTRHGIDSGSAQAFDAFSLTNVASATGSYAGETTDDTTTHTVDAVDVRLLKSVDDDVFEQGALARYTVELATSEYVSAQLAGDGGAVERPNRLVDDLADGLCPVFAPGTVLTDGGSTPTLRIGDPNPGGTIGAPLTAAEWNAALPAPIQTECGWDDATSGTISAPGAATLEGATLTGIAFSPDNGHFYLDLALDGADPLAANDTHEVRYSASQNSLYVVDDSTPGATSSGDSVSNTAEVVMTTRSIPALDGVRSASDAEAFGVERAWDDSTATLEAELSAMSKRVLERDAGAFTTATIAEAASSGGPDEADWVERAAHPFAIGDEVWYRVQVTPPTGSDVRNAVFTDFMPPGMRFDAGDPATSVRVVPSRLADVGTCTASGSEGSWLTEYVGAPTIAGDDQTGTVLTWQLGTDGCFPSTDRFFPNDTRLDIYLKATVTSLSAFEEVDLPENLAKYQQENVAGDIFFLRDAAEIELDQAVQLVKGIRDVDDVPAAGNDYLSDVDGLEVVQGDAVTFRLDVRGAGNTTTGYEIWDALPEGITKADLQGAQGDGTFTSASAAGVTGDPAAETPLPGGDWTATAYDPGDPGYPADLDPTVAAAGRSVVVWTVTATVPASIPESDTAPALPQGLTLGYTVLVPTDASEAAGGGPAALIGQTYENTASIVTYAAVNNAGGSTPLVPTGDDRLSTRDADTGAGEFAVSDEGTVDDSDVFLPNATMSKRLVETEIAPTGTTPTDPNNPATAIVQGEYATFEYTAVVPGNTSVRGGVLFDAGSLTRVSGGAMTPGTAPYRVESATLHAAPAGVTVVDVTGADPVADDTDFGFRTDTGRLVFPEHYSTGTTPETFTVRIVVWMPDRDATNPGTGTPERPSIANGALLRNTASFASLDAEGDARPALTGTATVEYREPNLGITKAASPDTAVQVGDAVTYRIAVTNTGRVASYDNTVVDTVPAGLEIDPNSFRIGTSTSYIEAAPVVAGTDPSDDVQLQPGVLTGVGGTLTWSHERFPILETVPATVYLFYQAEIDPTTGAGQSYVNTARVTGFTLPATLPDAVDRRGDRVAQTSETITATTAAIDKGVRIAGSGASFGPAASAPIGDTAEYRVALTLNPNINYYDVRVQDVLPTGVALDTASVQIGLTTGSGPEVDVTGDWSRAQSGQTHTWTYDLGGGDLIASPDTRTLVFTYEVLLSNTVAAGVTALPNTARFQWAQTDGGTPGTPLSDTANITVLDPVLTLTKLVDGEAAITRNPDASFDYTLRVAQAPASATPAYEITVRDVVPVGVQIDLGSISPTPSSTSGDLAGGAGGTITWQLDGPLHPQSGPGMPKQIELGYSATFVASADLDAGALTNTANVTHFESFPTGGRSYDPPLTGTGSIRDTADVTPLFPNVVPEKSVTDPVAGESYGLAYVDEAFGWTLTLRNQGSGVAQDIAITDELPANWEYAAGSAQLRIGSGPVVALGDPAVTTAAGVETLVWSDTVLRNAGATPLAAGGTLTLTFDAVPNADAVTDPGVGIETNAHTNTLRVTATDTQGADRNADGDYVGDDSTADAYLGSTDLRLVKEAIGGDASGRWIAGAAPSGDYAQPQWQITVTNHGPDASFGPFTIEDTTALPDGVTTGTFSARYFAGGADTTGTPLSLSGAGTAADPFIVGERSTSLAPDGSDRIVLVANVAITSDADVTVDAENSASVLGRTFEEPAKIPATPTNPNPNSDEAIQPLTALADLAIAKTVTNVETPNVGSTITWQLQPRNLGPSISVSSGSQPITLTDAVPANISEVADPSTPQWAASLNGAPWPSGVLAEAGDDITFTLVGSSLPVGLAPAVTLTGTISTAHTGTLTNAAEIVPGATTDPVDPNNRDEVTITPDDSTEVRIAKTRVVPDGSGGWNSSTTPIVPGDPVHYRITVTNDGPADARVVSVVDEVPVGLSYATHTDLVGTWTMTPGGTTSTGSDPSWNTFALAGTQGAGSAAATSFVVTYDTDPALITGDDVVENWAEVTAENDRDFDPDVQRDDDRSDSERIVDLGIEKSHAGAGPFDAGTAVEFTLLVTNHGPSATNGPIVVTDELPAGMAYVPGSAAVQVGTGAAASAEPALSGTDSRTLTWSLLTASDTVPVDGTITVTFDALIDAAILPQTLENVARVSGPDEDDTPDNDRDDDEVTTSTLSDMVLDKEVEAGPWVAGTDVEYTLTVRNDGPSAAAAVLTDTLPSGLTLVSASGTGEWDCTASVPGATTATCEHPLHPVGSGAQTTITLVAAIDPAVLTGTELDNVAQLAWSDRRGPHQAEDDAQITVSTLADLGLVKTAVDAGGAEINRVVPGADSQYRIEVTNHGPSSAVGPITVTDTLPLGVTFVDVTGTDWSADATSPVAGTPQVVTFTREPSTQGLAADAEAPDITFTVRIAPTVADGASLVNTATVTSPTPEPVPDVFPNTDDAEVTAEREVDLAVVKSHDPATVRIGDELPFTLDVQNLGPSEATGLVITDTIPAGLEVVDPLGPVLDADGLPTGWTIEAIVLAEPGDPTADPVVPENPTGGATVTASYADPLGPETAAAPLTLTARVTAEAYESVTNIAAVSGNETETDLDNNRSEDPVTVPPMVTLLTEKRVVGTLQVGEMGSYRISVENQGPTADPGPITITDALPAGLSFAGSPDLPAGVTVSASGGTVTWTLASGLAVGERVDLRLEVRVAQAAYPSVSNVVTVTTPSETTTGSELTDVVSSEVRAADPLAVTGADLALGLLLAAMLLLAAGAAATAIGRRARSAMPE